MILLWRADKLQAVRMSNRQAISTNMGSAFGLEAGPDSRKAFDAHWDALNQPEATSSTRIGTSVHDGVARGTGARGVGVVDGSGIRSTSASRRGCRAWGTAEVFACAPERRSPLCGSRLPRRTNRILRLVWDNGDRTVLVNADVGGITLGWNLNHTAADELFAAIEGTAFHTRIVLERMAEHGVRIDRVIHGGGVAQKNDVLNRVYANVIGKPVLVPERPITGLGSAIFAFLAAGAFETIEDAQRTLCPSYRVIEPDAREHEMYERLYAMYKSLYFAFGDPKSKEVFVGQVLPELRLSSRAQRGI